MTWGIELIRKLDRPFALPAALVLTFLWFVGCNPASSKTPVIELEEKADPIAAVASLSDPSKLKTLKPEARGVNGRYDKILYWLFIAEQKGIKPSQAIDKALNQNHTTEPRRSMVKRQLESSYTTAKLWGLFTLDNCKRLKRGNAGLITKGSFNGQLAEVDHIVPVSRYPQFANELANLQLMPAVQNRSKGNRMGAAEFEKLKELQQLSSVPVTKN